jgi:hypothetical protein
MRRIEIISSIGWAALTALILAAGSTTAFAHHSRPQFDRNVQRSISGTVKEFRLTNPHAWIDLTVETREGESESWSFEGDAVVKLTRAGWNAALLKPGDTVTVLFNPRRDGRPGGILRGVTTADGRFFSTSRPRLNLRFGGGS